MPLLEADGCSKYFTRERSTVMNQSLTPKQARTMGSFARSALLAGAVAIVVASCGSETPGSETSAEAVVTDTTPDQEAPTTQAPSSSEPASTIEQGSGDVPAASVTSSFTLAQVDDDCAFPMGSEDGLQVFLAVDDRLMRYDITTGDVVDHGAAPGACALWVGDVATGRKVAVSDAGTAFGALDGSFDVELSADRRLLLASRQIVGNRVLFASFDTGDLSMVVLDATTGEVVTEVEGLADLGSVTFGGDGSLIGLTSTITGGGGEAILLDAQTGEEVRRVAIDESGEESRFDQATGEMLVATAGGELITIDVESGEVVAQVPTSSSAEVVAIGVRPDGLVVIATEDQIETIDRLTGPTGVTAPIQDALAIRVRPDGTVLRIDNSGAIEIIALEGSGPLIAVASPG